MSRERFVRLGVAVASLGPVAARRARDRFGGWEAAAGAVADRPGAPEKLREAFWRAEDVGRDTARRCRELGVRIVFREDFPSRLEGLTDVPEVLFVRGDLARLEEPAVAIVGTRECSREGEDFTFRLASRLAEAGWGVTSGLARGIDTAAHRGALEEAGETVAVLGCGPDVAYPPENRELMERIARDGTIVSEFAPGAAPIAHRFPRRNRILAALADAVVVVECRLRSGARITARHALELGREVFAVPGSPGNPRADGPLEMLRQGARPIRHAEDLLEDLGGISGGPRPAPEEVEVLRVLRDGARSPEDVAEALAIGAQDARERLARLELLGFGEARGPNG